MKDLKGKNVFITGGAGFIGSNFVSAVLNEGARVKVYDNLSSGKIEHIKKFMGRKDFEFIHADLSDLEKVKASLGKDTDLIIHLAANPDIALGTKQTDLDIRQGTLTTYNVLEAARTNGVKDFIFSSSGSIYGVADVKPTPESYGPLLPISLYAASKIACEGLITSFSHLYGINYYIFRFGNVVGNNMTHGVTLDLINKLKKNPKTLEVLGDGKQMKSYIEVMDCINGMLTIYKKSPDGGTLYNLSTDDQCSVEEIAGMVIERRAKDAKIRYTGGKQVWPGDVPNSFLSTKKMKEIGVKLKFDTSKAVILNFIDNCVPE